MAKSGFQLFGKIAGVKEHLVSRNICPLCDQNLTPDRFVGGAPVCSCGWVDDKAGRFLDEKIEKGMFKTFIAFAIIFVLGYGHLLTWGSHALTVPFLKVSKMTGTISASGLESMIEACYSRSKWSCVEDNYAALYRKTQDVETLAKLAHFQKRMNKTKQAMQTYDSYIKAGGANTEALFRYATLVEEAGQKDAAMRLYAKSIAASKDRLPVRAMGSLLRLFMAEGRYQEAAAHLKAFYKSSGNARTYYVSEMVKINEALKGRKVAGR